jgi:hypothetical protein
VRLIPEGYWSCFALAKQLKSFALSETLHLDDISQIIQIFGLVYSVLKLIFMLKNKETEIMLYRTNGM